MVNQSTTTHKEYRNNFILIKLKMENNLNNLDDAINQFRESCQKYGFYSVKCDSKLANKNYFLIKNAVDFIRENNGEELLKVFLTSDCNWTKLWASTFLLKHFEQESILVLEDIESKCIPAISFDAKMVLQEWKKGNLKM
jgi:hypothetical protein